MQYLLIVFYAKTRSFQNLFPHVELLKKMLCTILDIRYGKSSNFSFKKKKKEKKKENKFIRVRKIKGPISIYLPLKNTAETKISKENAVFV